MLKVAIDSSETALKNADEVAEASGKAVVESVQNSTATVLKETEKNTDYLNDAGKKEIRIYKQPSQTIDNRIADNLSNTDIGKRQKLKLPTLLKMIRMFN